MDPFHFAIALPQEADSLALLRELSRSVAQLAGLRDAAARRAQEELESAVQQRMQGANEHSEVEVSFTRGPGDETVTVEIADVNRAAGAGAAAGSGGVDGNRRNPQRLLWDARRGQ